MISWPFKVTLKSIIFSRNSGLWLELQQKHKKIAIIMSDNCDVQSNKDMQGSIGYSF